ESQRDTRATQKISPRFSTTLLRLFEISFQALGCLFHGVPTLSEFFGCNSAVLSGGFAAAAGAAGVFGGALRNWALVTTIPTRSFMVAFDPAATILSTSI